MKAFGDSAGESDSKDAAQTPEEEQPNVVSVFVCGIAVSSPRLFQYTAGIVVVLTQIISIYSLYCSNVNPRLFQYAACIVSM